MSTLAGSGSYGYADGVGTMAQFRGVYDVAVDGAGNVYVTEEQRVRKITPAGVVSTLAGNGMRGYADGGGMAAQFNEPYGVAVDSFGNVYVADNENGRVRKIAPGGIVSTVAGNDSGGFLDGPGTVARFARPDGVAVDGSGNVYVADMFNHAIRKVTPAGVVSTLAGNGIAGSADGTGTVAQFSYPEAVAVDGVGNIYVVDLNSGVRKVTPGGVVSTLASGVRGSGVAVDGGGTVYVAETYNNRILKITLGSVITTLAGSGTPGFADGTGAAAKFSSPNGLAMDVAGNLYVADERNYRIRKISPTGVVSTLAGSGLQGHADGAGAVAQFWEPQGVDVDAAGSVYVADWRGNRIRKITPTGEVSTLAGTGPGGLVEGPAAVAQLDGPTGVAVDALGNLYVSDWYNNRIRKVTGNYLQAVITNQPTIVTLSAGQTVVFSVTNTGPLSYQWQKDGGDLPGANTNSLTVPVASRAAAGIYSVMVGGAGSSPAVLRVLVPQRLDPVERLGSGGFRLRFGDHDGSPLGESDKGRFIIQWTTISSSPAFTWNDLANTTRTVSGGKVMLDDTSASSQASRFYRVIER